MPKYKKQTLYRHHLFELAWRFQLLEAVLRAYLLDSAKDASDAARKKLQRDSYGTLILKYRKKSPNRKLSRRLGKLAAVRNDLMHHEFLDWVYDAHFANLTDKQWERKSQRIQRLIEEIGECTKLLSKEERSIKQQAPSSS